MTYDSAVDSANAEAAEQLYAAGMRSADSGDLSKAVKMLERAARLHPRNEVYTSKLKALARQLDAVKAESARDQRERTAQGGNAGDGWSNGASTDDGADAHEQHAHGSPDSEEPAGSTPRARSERRSLTEQWSKVKAWVFALLLTSPRWMGEWAVSWLPRDEERAYRLTYSCYYWLGTLEVPIILGVIGLVCRLVCVFPWTVFFLLCAAAAPLGYLIGKAAGIKRRVLGVLVGAHLLFVYGCPTAAAYLYCAVLWLAFAAVFRTIALVATAALGSLWFFPWTVLYLVLFAGWAMLLYCAPLPIGAASALLCFGWYYPMLFVLVASWLCAAVGAYARAPFALPVAVVGTAAWWWPAYAPRGALLLALVLALRWRAQLRELWAHLFGASADDGLARPRDGTAAVAHVLGASTHYEVLALSRSASLAQIKSAYKRMALLLHPDKNQHPQAADAFERVMKANECVSSARLRAAYDIKLRFPDTDENDEDDDGYTAPSKEQQRSKARRPQRPEPSHEHRGSQASGSGGGGGPRSRRRAK